MCYHLIIVSDEQLSYTKVSRDLAKQLKSVYLHGLCMEYNQQFI